MIDKIREHLGERADLLEYSCSGVEKDMLHLPGPDFVDRVVAYSDRSPGVMRNINWLFNTGRLAGTGYVSILPVDQGIEHSGAASFASSPLETILKNFNRSSSETLSTLKPSRFRLFMCSTSVDAITLG